MNDNSLNLLTEQNEDHKQVQHAAQRVGQHVGNITNQAETLLSVINTSVEDVNQPITAILNRSELVLSQTDPDSPLAIDLVIIIEEIRRMREIIQDLNISTYCNTTSEVNSKSKLMRSR